MRMKAASSPIESFHLFDAENSMHPSSNNPLDCRPASTGPSVLQRTIVAVLGLSMLVSGPCIFFLNLDSQGWAWACALITTWSGLTLLLLLCHCGCRSPDLFGRKDRGDLVSTTARDTNRVSPLIETLAELGRITSSRSVVLLSAEGAKWRLRIGWNCSQHVGMRIARLLEGRVERKSQSLHDLSLIDGAASAFCTPMHLNSGHSLLLVMLNEVNHAMNYNASTLALQASFRIVGQIRSACHLVPSRDSSYIFPSSQGAFCCSVCQSLSTQDGRWLPWGDWLNETHGFSLSHTFCENCSQWLYGLDDSQVKVA